MAVRIRMKKMGRTHRPYFRICAMDQRSPRDGRVIEELGTYDPMCPETDARTTLKIERIQHWIGIGAQPSDKVAVLIKKYGVGGTHLAQQEAAMVRMSHRKDYTPATDAPVAKKKPDPKPEPAAEKPAEEKPADS